MAAVLCTRKLLITCRTVSQVQDSFVFCLFLNAVRVIDTVVNNDARAGETDQHSGPVSALETILTPLIE